MPVFSKTAAAKLEDELFVRIATYERRRSLLRDGDKILFAGFKAM
jgi:hypothetical protein